jgi:hypothetical protein
MSLVSRRGAGTRLVPRPGRWWSPTTPAWAPPPSTRTRSGPASDQPCSTPCAQRAARIDAGLPAHGPVALVGYAEGGGAAGWAAQLQTTYAPDVPLWVRRSEACPRTCRASPGPSTAGRAPPVSATPPTASPPPTCAPVSRSCSPPTDGGAGRSGGHLRGCVGPGGLPRRGPTVASDHHRPARGACGACGAGRAPAWSPRAGDALLVGHVREDDLVPFS